MSCPAGVLRYNEERGALDIEDLSLCTLYGECMRTGVVRVKPREDQFALSFETIGAVTSEQAFLASLHALKNKLTKIQGAL